MIGPRRILLFARDMLTELPSVWSLARMGDCERYGGHRWNASPWHWADDGCVVVIETCARCAAQRAVQPAPVSGTTYTLTVGHSN